MTAVLGLGAGGHAKVVIEILRAGGVFEVVGLLDPRQELWGTEVLGVRVLGDDDLLGNHYDSGVRHVFIGLGSVGDTTPRVRLYERATAAGYDVVSAIHPAATVSSSAELGAGPTIMAGAVVNAAARLGDDVVVNTGAIVEHDCVLGDHVHVASGARLASGVVVEEGAHVGVGASVRQSVTIGRHAVVGAGAAVVADVAADTVVVGVPARELRAGRG